MQTVICAFEDRQTAQRAIEGLVDAGFSRSNVHLQAGSGTGTGAVSTTTDSSMSGSYSDRTDRDEGGFLSSVGGFFSSLFGSDTPSGDAGTYSEAVRRGNAVVVVDATSEDEAERAADIMDSFGAVDIDERASQWRSGGWDGFDENAGPLPATASAVAAAPMLNTQPAAAKATDGQTVMNVVQEELQVGKRSVDRGGVRVIQRVSETPVSEMIKLREERAMIERRPVDRTATAADLSTFKDGTIEVRETSEEAVVAKTARVVEEVVVGKDVQERTETISDTVRRKDVDIERFEGQTQSQGQTGSLTRDTREHATASEKIGAGLRDLKNDVKDTLRGDTGTSGSDFKNNSGGNRNI